MMLHGLSLINGVGATASGKTFRAFDPGAGKELEPVYHEALPAEAERACELAAEASAVYGRTSGGARGKFLRGIADEMEALGDSLLERFVAETGLPRGRAENERGRTCGQLRLFADLIEADGWAEVRQEAGQPDRKPQPKPELRSMLRPIGPVAVFGPANFPLAFSVAGGDTVSALAAGCPVVVKAHSSHPGTSELVGAAINRAARKANLPPGVFALLFGSGRSVGQPLVRHPAVRAVGFTGSKSAGRELYALCAARPVPIPFFGELSSINPVCLLPAAVAARGESIAEGLAASVTLGCGQFCTNPGLVLYVEHGPGAPAMIERLTERLRGTAPAPMLNPGTQRSYADGLARVGRTAGVETLLAGGDRSGSISAAAALFRCSSDTFRRQSSLHEEIFGPATLLIACRDLQDMTATVAALEGQLTGTIHQESGDLQMAADLLQVMEERVGRIVFDGFPTGVEVGPAIVHGGPWPATTDSRFTSVGTGAIRRWLRPVCWQNAPQGVLPAALRG